jgi:hypothetical protein
VVEEIFQGYAWDRFSEALTVNGCCGGFLFVILIKIGLLNFLIDLFNGKKKAPAFARAD